MGGPGRGWSTGGGEDIQTAAPARRAGDAKFPPTPLPPTPHRFGERRSQQNVAKDPNPTRRIHKRGKRGEPSQFSSGTRSQRRANHPHQNAPATRRVHALAPRPTQSASSPAPRGVDRRPRVSPVRTTKSNRWRDGIEQKKAEDPGPARHGRTCGEQGTTTRNRNSQPERDRGAAPAVLSKKRRRATPAVHEGPTRSGDLAETARVTRTAASKFERPHESWASGRTAGQAFPLKEGSTSTVGICSSS